MIFIVFKIQKVFVNFFSCFIISYFIYFNRKYLGAWPAFVLSLAYIGVLTACVEQVHKIHFKTATVYIEFL